METAQIAIMGESCNTPAEISVDGTCDRIVNLRYRGNSWHPVGEPRWLYEMDQEKNIFFVHHHYNQTHLFSYDGQNLYVEAEEIDGQIKQMIGDPYTKNVTDNGIETIQQIPIIQIPDLIKAEGIGQMVVLVSKQRIEYLTFKDNHYLNLGESPELPMINFFTKKTDTFHESKYGGCQNTNGGYPYKPIGQGGENRELADNNDLTGLGDKIIATREIILEKLNEDNLLHLPFCVRYAFRTKDNRHMMPSPPILIFPETYKQGGLDTIQNTEPIVWSQIGNYVVSGDNKTHTLDGDGRSLKLYGHELFLELENGIDLSKWEGVISSVDIFISRPKDWLNKKEYYKIRRDTIDSKSSYVIEYKTMSLEDSKESFVQNNLFFKVGSLVLNDIKNSISEKKIDLSRGLLKNLETQQQLLPEELTNHKITGTCSTIINGRLHMGSIQQKLFDGFSLEQLTYKQSTSIIDSEFRKIKKYILEVKLDSEAGESRLIKKQEYETGKLFPPFSSLITYPDPRAKEINLYIFFSGNPALKISVKLESSHTHGFAFGFIDTLRFPDEAIFPFIPIYSPNLLNNSNVSNINGEEIPIESYLNILYEPNKIRVSSMNNPVYFPAEQTYYASNDKVLGFGSPTAAISQGQFGQFPLYIFCNEGIWLMQGGGNGILYAGQSLVSKEICQYPESICPIDKGILFASARGIAMISGGETIQLALPLEGCSSIDIPYTIIANPKLRACVKSNTPFIKYINKAQIVFNHPYNEVYISNPDFHYHYVLCMDSNQWSRRTNKWKHLCYSFPDLYATNSIGQIATLNHEDEAENMPVLILTRALKLRPYVAKRIRSVILRGCAENAHRRLSLWASNKGKYNWLCIGMNESTVRSHFPHIEIRSRAAACKYHRICFEAQVSSESHFDKFETMFTLSKNNKLR